MWALMPQLTAALCNIMRVADRVEEVASRLRQLKDVCVCTGWWLMVAARWCRAMSSVRWSNCSSMTMDILPNQARLAADTFSRHRLPAAKELVEWLKSK